MHKKHISQDRSNPQTQASSMSSTHTYTLDENGGNSSQNLPMSSIEPEDDDDICPVCESECTCANRSRNSTTLPTHNYQSGYVFQDASKKSSGNMPAPTGLPSLKIKLTLPPRPSQSSASTSSKSSNTRSSLSKKKSKYAAEMIHVGETTGDSPGNSLFSISGQAQASGSAHDVQYKAEGSIPKKRGRPTKAVIAAREAAKSASEARHLDEGTGQSMGNVIGTRRSKPPVPRRLPQLISPSNAKNKGKKLHGAAAASRARAQQRKVQEKKQRIISKRQAATDEIESSELSDLDDEHPFGLPTFVPALSSSSNASSSDSGSDTDSDCDKGIPPYPRPQHISPIAVADDVHLQRKREYHNTWDIRIRKRSVGADGSSDAGMDTDSGDDEEEGEGEDEGEGEGDDEADENDEDADDLGAQQVMRYSGIATGWTDDEESSFDADLFFANLSDSSEVSGDEQMGDGAVVPSAEIAQRGANNLPNAAGFDTMRLSEVAAAGFLAPFADLERSATENLPFGHGWDHFLLPNNTLLDLDADSSRRLPLGSLLEAPIPGYEEAEAMMATSEEEEAVAMFENCSQTFDEEEVLEIFEDSDEGETTEDEFVEVDGVATPRREVLLRFPASLGAIDPMSTLSSPLKGPVEREKKISTVPASQKSRRPVPKPSDILSGRAFFRENAEIIKPRTIDRSSKLATSAPALGCFIPPAAEKSRHVVISSSESSSERVIPCPYPVVRRLRGRGTSVSMMSRSGSDRSYRSRTPSLLCTTRSPFETFGSGGFDGLDDAQLPPAEPIQLDDVIDTKFLEPEPERSDGIVPDSTTSETGEVVETCESDSERDHHLENLRRWDRIPIDAFRQTRSMGSVNNLADKMDVVIGTPRAPRPSDGFSYGSAVGGMMRGSPLSATLWESSVQAGSRVDATQGNKRGKLSSLLISPVLLPTRDGDRTPTAERQQQRQQQQTYSSYASQHAAYAQQNIKSRKELRKEKKRNRKYFGSVSSHLRHNHFPNAKSRASGSMQRSSMPSLSL